MTEAEKLKYVQSNTEKAQQLFSHPDVNFFDAVDDLAVNICNAHFILGDEARESVRKMAMIIAAGVYRATKKGTINDRKTKKGKP